MTDPYAQARAEIRPTKEAIEHDLLEKKNVVGVDIAEKVTGGQKTGELSIVVFVDTKQPLSKVAAKDRVPEVVDGVKTDVQEVQIELQAMSAMTQVEDRFSAFIDATAYSTLEGGISMGPLRSVHLAPPDAPAPGNYVFVGTLGAMVRDRATGAAMALTNFHVACVNNSWSVGDRMVQQSLVDGGSAAGQFGSLSRATLSDQVDGAVVTVDATKPWTASVHGVGGVAGHTAATVGTAVQKRGRTTEHTFGSVVSTDLTVSINYGSDVGVHTFHHQIRIDTDTTRSTRFSDRGDSGSVILDNNRNVVGLLFGGATDGSMTFANPIQSVLDELGVDMVKAPAIVKSKPILTCLNTKLDTICGIEKSKTVICESLKSKFVVCLTKGTPFCDLPVDVFSKPPCIPIRFSRACGDEWEIPPIWRRGGRGGLGGGFDVGGYGGSAPSMDEAYLAGYLTALEEIQEADAAQEEG